MKNNKGFTLIELLVVIAIIGILSSVVLASLNSARTKGDDTAVKANLASVRSQAGIFYDNNSGSYAGMCSDNVVSSALSAAASANGGTAPECDISVDGSAYAIQSVLKTAGSYWCVDSTGTAKNEGATLASVGSPSACQ